MRNTSVPTATDREERTAKVGARFQFMGEDHIDPKGVVFVFERTSDGHVFTVRESALKDEKGVHVPEHIRARLVR